MSEPDRELQREAKIAIGGFLLMWAAFMLFFGTYGELHEFSGRGRPDLINKAVMGAPTLLYFAMYIFFAPADNGEEKDLTRWEWMQVHWRLLLGCVVFEALCLAAWISYLHHHGFPHVS